MINGAWSAYYMLRVKSGILGIGGTPDFLVPMLVLYVFWAGLFAIAGLYRPLYAASRLDELVTQVKTVTVGCLLLFFLIFVDDAATQSGSGVRMLMALYWMIVSTATGFGRALVRSVQRRLLISGVGTRRTLIVGSRTKSEELFDQVSKYPALGYKVVGFVGLHERRVGNVQRGIPVLGTVDSLHELLEHERVREVLVALDSRDHGRLLDIMSRCNGNNIGLKIMPDMYDIVSGQARINPIHGFPLIEISPQLMHPWEEAAKRILDLSVSLFILILGFPVWFLIAVLIKLESPGPMLYRQERVGKNGVHFKIVKFRSMLHDAEKHGPQWADKRDPRVTRVGRLLRQLHFDEIPQVLNVLKGEMSLIGPRPERPVFVERLTLEIPMYGRRLKVRPGVTGWAQVKHKYDETIDDVRKKVQYDLYYIENMSFRMDIKIMLHTILHMMMGKGH